MIAFGEEVRRGGRGRGGRKEEFEHEDSEGLEGE